MINAHYYYVVYKGGSHVMITQAVALLSQIPRSMEGMPGTMTPFLTKTLAFYDSGPPTEARVITFGPSYWEF